MPRKVRYWERLFISVLRLLIKYDIVISIEEFQPTVCSVLILLETIVQFSVSQLSLQMKIWFLYDWTDLDLYFQLNHKRYIDFY